VAKKEKTRPKSREQWLRRLEEEFAVEILGRLKAEVLPGEGEEVLYFWREDGEERLVRTRASPRTVARDLLELYFERKRK